MHRPLPVINRKLYFTDLRQVSLAAGLTSGTASHHDEPAHSWHGIRFPFKSPNSTIRHFVLNHLRDISAEREIRPVPSLAGWANRTSVWWGN